MALYDAFISYSHVEDHAIAEALQSVTQILGKPWYRRRLLRVFRDDASLPATAKLWSEIAKALEASRYFILLASPESARSPWVARELTYWLDHKGADSLLIGLTAGNIRWDDGPGDFDWRTTDAIPSLLVGRLHAEPRWIDLRQFRDGRNLYDRVFKSRAADFAAAVLSIPKEDLLSRELQQQRRLYSFVSLAAGALLVLVGLATWQWNRAADADRLNPRTQITAFNNFLLKTLVPSASEEERHRLMAGLEILAVEDLNGDSFLDFIIFLRGSDHCGSGGCTMDVYLSEGNGNFRNVLELFGYSSPRVRKNITHGFREISASSHHIDGRRVWGIYQWDGDQQYELSRYLYCGELPHELCIETESEPNERGTVIDPLDDTRYRIRQGAPVRAEPNENAQIIDHDASRVIGKFRGLNWYLIDYLNGTAGFVHGDDVTVVR